MLVDWSSIESIGYSCHQLRHVNDAREAVQLLAVLDAVLIVLVHVAEVRRLANVCKPWVQLYAPQDEPRQARQGAHLRTSSCAASGSDAALASLRVAGLEKVWPKAHLAARKVCCCQAMGTVSWREKSKLQAGSLL